MENKMNGNGLEAKVQVSTDLVHREICRCK